MHEMQVKQSRSRASQLSLRLNLDRNEQTSPQSEVRDIVETFAIART